MDRTVPAGAALLLDFIGSKEAPRGYNTIYGNNQGKLPKPVTSMTLREVQAAQPGWSKRFGSSATGRYQFMHRTLKGLWEELGLSGSQMFSADLQDRLGYHLLKRRGYEAYVAGKISRIAFGKRLAQEWASFPVLAATRGAHRNVSRGQSYYAGDGINKSLVSASAVEAVLDEVFAVANAKTPDPQTPIRTIDPSPEPEPAPVDAGTNKAAVGVGIIGAIAAALYAAWEWIF